MEALPPALRKPRCVLIVCCNIRIAAAWGRGVLGPAAIPADTGLSLFAPVTWLGGYQATALLFQGAASIFSLEEILMFAQFMEQNIISTCSNSSSACSSHPHLGIRVLVQLHTLKLLWEEIVFLQVSARGK